MYEEERYEIKEYQKKIEHEFMVWFKERRESMSVSQLYISKNTGIARPYISQLETGVRSPSIGTIAKLVKALGYKIVIEPDKQAEVNRRRRKR